MKQTIVHSSRVAESLAGRASPAVQAGPYVFLSGQSASSLSRGLALEAQSAGAHQYPIKLQTDYALRNIGALLETAGSSIEQTVKIQTFHTRLDDLPGHLDARRQHFTPPPPPSTAVECGLIGAGAEIEIDAIGIVPDSQTRREVVNTDRAPRPLAPYSQAVKAGQFIFVAGVLAADFKTGVAPPAQVPPGLPYFGSPIKRQTEYILTNIGHILEAAGSSLDQVVKAHVVLTDIRDFYGFEEVWRQFFSEDPPVRSVFQGGLVNPGCIVEIDVVALAPESGVRKEVIATDRAPLPTIAESQAIRTGNFVFVGGQMATDYRTGLAPEARIDPNFPRYVTPIRKQGDLVLRQLQAILEASGTTLDRVVKVWAFHTQARRDLAGALELYEEFFPKDPPANTTVETPALIVPECCLMLDAIAVMPDVETR